MPDFETITYAAADGLATITLARPDKRNAMNVTMFQEVADAADLVRADPDVRGLLLRAEGPSFCAGIDLSAMAEIAGTQGMRFRSFIAVAQRPFRVLARLEKPSVAAVRGHAVGAGFQLALACDLRVGAPDTRFAMLEARYGLIPDLGGMHHLARLVGPARAKELVWSARSVESREAEALGLLNRVVEDDVDGEAERLLDAVTAHSPITAGLVKALVDRATETPLEVELEREAHAQAVCVASEDHREAVAAFVERREPVFRGR